MCGVQAAHLGTDYPRLCRHCDEMPLNGDAYGDSLIMIDPTL